MKIIIYDFEVFKFDTLLGCYILSEGEQTLYQTWNIDEIKQFYYDHKEDMWIGHNNFKYDDLILEAIINNKNPYKKSKELIGSQYKPRCYLPLYSFDLLSPFLMPFSLKHTELLIGKSIETTEVDFDLDRPLTYEEKKLTEKYNVSDLNQTYYNFLKFYDVFKLRLDIISEFKLDLMKNLRVTGTQLAANVLGAKKDPSLIYKPIKRKLYDNLILENQEIKDFFLKGESKDKQITITIGNVDIVVGDGGLHGAEKKYFCKKAIYADVTGYYNNIMINYDLFSRTIPEEGKELYKYMFKEQVRLKKINPVKRKVYKTILLAVFGATNSLNSDFYDPHIFSIITNTGELFMCDLLEKVAPYATIVQVNTDGAMFEPKDWNDYDKIIKIIEEWEARTKFTCKKEFLYNLYQRDINNYVFQDADGKIEVKGEALKNYDLSDQAYAQAAFFNAKEPPIIAKGIVNCLIYDIDPEETVKQEMNNLKMFQYACKKGTYNYLTYDSTYFPSTGTSSYKIQSPSRAFALKSNSASGMVYKHGINKKSGKESKAKVSNLPDNVFIYNKDITTAYNELKDKIDYNYYVNRIYERVGEFIG